MESRDEAHKEIAERIAHGIAERIAHGIALAMAFAAFILIGGVVVQWLWNWLLPEIFGLPRITFWQALGLLALSRILFGGFGGSRLHDADGRRRRREWWRTPRRQGESAVAQNTVTESGRS